MLIERDLHSRRKVNRNACLYLPEPTVNFISKHNVEKAVTMGLRDFLTQCARTMKLAVKPGRSELWLSIKICLLGLGAVGLVGFIIKLLSSTLQPGTPAA